VSVRPGESDPIEVAVDNWEKQGWIEAAAPMGVVTSVMRVQQILAADIDRALKPFELSFARFEFLRLLAFSRRGTLPMGVVGERLQVHPASVTNAADRLERDGLVSRSRDDSDRRKVIVGITSLGRERVEAATCVLNDYFVALPLSAEQQRSLFGELRLLRAANGDVGSPSGEDVHNG
jgi:DNA-binding MarR family transcriptional regulator